MLSTPSTLSTLSTPSILTSRSRDLTMLSMLSTPSMLTSRSRALCAQLKQANKSQESILAKSAAKQAKEKSSEIDSFDAEIIIQQKSNRTKKGTQLATKQSNDELKVQEIVPKENIKPLEVIPKCKDPSISTNKGKEPDEPSASTSSGYPVSSFAKAVTPKQSTAFLPLTSEEFHTMDKIVINFNDAINEIKDTIESSTKKRKNYSLSRLDPETSSALKDYIGTEFHNKKEFAKPELKKIVDDFITVVAPNEMKIEGKPDAYYQVASKKIRDMRGHVRSNFNKLAKLYFLNGSEDWPKTEAEKLDDAKKIMHSVFKGKHKLTEADIHYAKAILKEWLEHGGKLDPNFKGNTNHSDDDDEVDTTEPDAKKT